MCSSCGEMWGRSMVRWSFLGFLSCFCLGAIGCDDDRALTQRQFAELVCERVEEEYAGVMTSRLNERGFDYVRSNGDRGRLVVSEEYGYYTQNPDSLDMLVERLASLPGARDRLKQVSDDRERLHRYIMPVLKRREFLAEAQARASGQQMLYGEHASGLLVFYVLDEPTSLSFLTTASLAGLELSFRELNDIAISNLGRRTGEDRYVVERTEEGIVAVGDTRDGFDAARLLSPTLTMTLSRVLDTSSMIIAVPRRDLMLAAPAAVDADFVDAFRSRVRAEFGAGPYAISPELFLLDPEGLRRFPE